MRSTLAVLVLVGAGLMPLPVQAIGCISGGLAAGAVGHLMHHGLLGALGGCIAGHELNKHQERQQNQMQYQRQQQYPQQQYRQ
jgi:uncharacterized protein YcfJ